MKVRIGQTLQCERCGYGKPPKPLWYVRKTDVRICPNCKSAYFNVPREVRKNVTKS